ncbi:hypothetical protein CgunFtcFv8_017014 [Champsocephalus gunnari]|nr:hypothetical protein CgunFtcFv8_017014 [Champsocephalus gunnari]
MGVKTLLLALLIAALEGAGSMPGSLTDVISTDVSLRGVVLAAAVRFNDQSNDAFLFKPSAILRAQRQVVKGLRYVVDLEISRTLCRKRDQNQDLTRCDLQPEGSLQQTFECHTEVWVVPWSNETRTLEMDCQT